MPIRALFSRSNETVGQASGPMASCPFGYYHINYAANAEECSPRLCEMLGMDVATEELDSLSQHLEEEDFQILMTAIEELQEEKDHFELTVAVRGGEKKVTCTGTRCLAADGKLESVTLWFAEANIILRQYEQLRNENETLREELKCYISVLNAAPFPVWKRSKDMTIAYCNPTYSSAVEQNSEDIIGTEALELDKQGRNRAMHALESGTPQYERRHVVIGGQRRFYAFTDVPLEHRNMIAGYAVDLTELDNALKDIKRYISAQADLLESSASAMAIFGADKRLKSYNNAYVKLWELEEAWLDEQPTFAEILEHLREKRKLPEQANFVDFKQKQLRQFTDLINPEEEFFFLPNEKTLRVLTIPHALGGLLFVYEDVTDRLALERSYNTLIAVQRATLDNLHEGVAVFGEDGKLRLCNPVYQRLWQLDQGFLQEGVHLGDIMDATKHFYLFDDWRGFRDGVIGLIHTRKATFQRLQRSDDSVIEWSSVPLPDGATLMTYYDVTDSTLVERSLREKNEALEEADRLKTDFLANVSYELRSPLTSIMGFVEILLQQYFGQLTDKQREYVNDIHDSSLHLMKLIDDIIDLACIEAGYMQLQIEEFGIGQMIESTVALVRERAREKEIDLSVEVASDAGIMLADETRLKKAMFNLLANAIQFTREGGAITIGVKTVEDNRNELLFWVSDNGIGIPQEEQNQIFERFYQIIEGGRQKSGAGLGLSMVKSFVSLHGGRVQLDSMPGEGTTVRCYLPRIVEPQETPARLIQNETIGA